MWTYGDPKLGGGRFIRERLVVTVRGGVVDPGEGEAVVIIVSDGEALEHVRKLANEVEESLVARLEESAVPRTSATVEIGVARLPKLSELR